MGASVIIEVAIAASHSSYFLNFSSGRPDLPAFPTRRSSDLQVASAVAPNTAWKPKLGVGGRPAVPAEAIRPIPGYSLNIRSEERRVGKAMVFIVGDKDVEGDVNKHAAGVAQNSAGGWTTVAAESIASIH